MDGRGHIRSLSAYFADPAAVTPVETPRIVPSTVRWTRVCNAAWSSARESQHLLHLTQVRSIEHIGSRTVAQRMRTDVWHAGLPCPVVHRLRTIR